MRKFIGALALTCAAPLASANTMSVCVFDVIGANGDVFNVMKDYALEMRSLGVNLQLKPYTDEGVAVGDFNAGQCDAVAATDLRTRPFNKLPARSVPWVPCPPTTTWKPCWLPWLSPGQQI